MFHNRTLNNEINKLHERALRITYKDEKPTFYELLEKDKSVTLHERNIQKLATLMYKVKNKISPPIINETFNGCDYLTVCYKKTPKFGVNLMNKNENISFLAKM